jgi:hypothetical protein
VEVKARLTGARTTKTIISTMRKVAPKIIKPINHNTMREMSKRTVKAVSFNMRTIMKMTAMAASQ